MVKVTSAALLTALASSSSLLEGVQALRMEGQARRPAVWTALSPVTGSGSGSDQQELIEVTLTHSRNSLVYSLTTHSFVMSPMALCTMTLI
jgi:hypothetical protein